MFKTLIVGADSGIGSAIYKLLPNSVCTSRKEDSKFVYLDLEKDFPTFETTFDEVYYCLAINDNDLQTINVNAVLSFQCLDHLAKFVNDGGTVRVLTSIVGSFTKGSTMPANQANIYYRMSKAALNIGVAELSKIHSKVNWQLVHPGFVKTKLTMGLSYIDQADDPLLVAEKLVKLPKIEGLSYIELDTNGTRLVV